jgi:hypothetical protein
MLALLPSLTGGGRSVGIVHSRTEAMELELELVTALEGSEIMTVFATATKGFAVRI